MTLTESDGLDTGIDVARFAETNGYERELHQPQAWKYRDYVIRAFNLDKPYNRFILEQIASNELPQRKRLETLIATGFNRLGAWDDEAADPETDRFDQLRRRRQYYLAGIPRRDTRLRPLP